MSTKLYYVMLFFIGLIGSFPCVQACASENEAEALEEVVAHTQQFLQDVQQFNEVTRNQSDIQDDLADLDQLLSEIDETQLEEEELTFVQKMRLFLLYCSLRSKQKWGAVKQHVYEQRMKYVVASFVASLTLGGLLYYYLHRARRA